MIVSRGKWYRGIRWCLSLAWYPVDCPCQCMKKINRENLFAFNCTPDCHYCCPNIWTCFNVVGRKAFLSFSWDFKNKSTVMRHL